MTDGVMIVAIGEAHAQCAVRCVESLREDYSGPVCVISDRERTLNAQLSTLNVQVLSVPGEGDPFHTRRYKVELDQWTVFDGCTVYLDADCEVRGPIEPLFTVPDGYLMAACQGWPPCIAALQEDYPQLADYDPMLPIINSGVFSFRKTEAARRFFRAWAVHWPMRFRATSS